MYIKGTFKLAPVENIGEKFGIALKKAFLVVCCFLRIIYEPSGRIAVVNELKATFLFQLSVNFFFELILLLFLQLLQSFMRLLPTFLTLLLQDQRP